MTVLTRPKTAQALFRELPVGSELLNSAIVCAAAIAIILAVSATAGMVFLLVVAALPLSLPAIVVCLVFQRHLIKGLTPGMGR